MLDSQSDEDDNNDFDLDAFLIGTACHLFGPNKVYDRIALATSANAILYWQSPGRLPMNEATLLPNGSGLAAVDATFCLNAKLGAELRLGVTWFHHTNDDDGTFQDLSRKITSKLLVSHFELLGVEDNAPAQLAPIFAAALLQSVGVTAAHNGERDGADAVAQLDLHYPDLDDATASFDNLTCMDNDDKDDYMERQLRRRCLSLLKPSLLLAATHRTDGNGDDVITVEDNAVEQVIQAWRDTRAAVANAATTSPAHSSAELAASFVNEAAPTKQSTTATDAAAASAVAGKSPVVGGSSKPIVKGKRKAGGGFHPRGTTRSFKRSGLNYAG